MWHVPGTAQELHQQCSCYHGKSNLVRCQEGVPPPPPHLGWAGCLAVTPDHPSALYSFLNVVLAFPKEPLEICRAVKKKNHIIKSANQNTCFGLLFADAYYLQMLCDFWQELDLLNLGFLIHKMGLIIAALSKSC